MKKIQKKKGVTLLALAITIIIMLLLAGVVMQMALGDNGLFVRATKSKLEQAKSELYETAKLEYLNLKTKSIEQGQQDPPVSAVLSETNFLAKYDLDGSNIKDKKGEIIDTRDNLLDKLEGMSSSDIPTEPVPQTYPEQSYPRTIDGVTIQEYDKDKMILKIKIKEQTKLAIGYKSYIPDPYNIEVEWGNWGYNTFKPGNGSQAEHEYYPGEYTMKIKGAKSFSLESTEWSNNHKFEVTVLHWGKFENDPDEKNIIRLMSVKDIKMPEPNDVTVEYNGASLSNIPEDLFKYKPTRKKMSFFQSCQNITSIPEDLYKYNTGMTELYGMFSWCNNLATIPEGLFKYNKNVTNINTIFLGTKITTIPENLFKYNTGLRSISHLFSGPTITNVPENIFKYNKELVNISYIFRYTSVTTVPENLFKYNTKLNNVSGLFRESSVKTIPENLFKYNTEIESFDSVFVDLQVLENIPEKIFSNNKKVKRFHYSFGNNVKLKTIPENLFKNNTEVESFSSTFQNCKELESIPENLFKYNTKTKNFENTFSSLIKIQSIPGNLFYNNTEVENFESTFSSCEKLSDIPWNLFQNNNKVNNFRRTFSYCTALTHGDLPNRCYSLQEHQYYGIFRGCTNAYNYSSMPESWKN